MFTHCFAIGISLTASLPDFWTTPGRSTGSIHQRNLSTAHSRRNNLRSNFEDHESRLGIHMLIVALLKLTVNLISSHKDSLNISILSYSLGCSSSVGIVIAAIIIFYTGWNIIDPLVSLGISGVIIYWAFGVLKESTRILLEMAPAGLNTEIIIDDLKENFLKLKRYTMLTYGPSQAICSSSLRI